MYPSPCSQAIINDAISVRARAAELLFCAIDVEEVTFNRGFYTVDVRYFYKITGEAYTPLNHSAYICGLAVFDKRVILFGSEGSAKIFSSNTVLGGLDMPSLKKSNLPKAVVEAVDPILLNMKLVECHKPCGDFEICDIPTFIANSFDGGLQIDNTDKRVYVTLGQFSIIRLERDSQLLIPAYDYCMPEKECVGPGDDDPCSLFSRIDFPVGEFFPPDSMSCPEGYREARANLPR